MCYLKPNIKNMQEYCFIWVSNWDSHNMVKMQAEGAWEQGAEEDIWT
jgi:hypothetical protein